MSGRAEGVNVLQVAPAPDVIDVSRLPFRKDGTSIYRPPYEERFCTAEHRDREQYLVDVAVLPVPQRVTAEAAAAALAGTDLDYSQREACLGLLTSGRLINCLVAPAGTGKTHVMAAFARAWDGQRAGRVIGLTASTNAARVMADEAAKAGAPMQTFNIARFLGKIKDSDKTRGHVPVLPVTSWWSMRPPRSVTEDVLRHRPDSPAQRRHGGRHIRPRAARRGRRRRDLPPDRRAARVLPADRGPPVQSRMGAGRFAAAARWRRERPGRVQRPGPDLPRAAGPGA